MKYKFSGKSPVVIPKVGVVYPGQEIETENTINHPLFREIKPQKGAKK